MDEEQPSGFMNGYDAQQRKTEGKNEETRKVKSVVPCNSSNTSSVKDHWQA